MESGSVYYGMDMCMEGDFGGLGGIIDHITVDGGGFSSAVFFLR